LSNIVAEIALAPEIRSKILERNRSMLRRNLQLFTRWLEESDGLFEWVPPEAGSMAFLRYHLDVNSTELAEWLRTEKGVFIVAGDHFGMDSFIRIGIGSEADYLQAGLDRVREGLVERFGL
jgi:aspartate/methionine/tyrosine aminotransferase